MKRIERLQTISVARAREFDLLNTYIGQRRKSEGHVTKLAEKILDGRFHVGQFVLITLLDGQRMLLDGQHQCEAVIAANKSIRAIVIEYVQEKGDTNQDVADVFAQLSPERPRSRGDIAWMYGCQIGMDQWPKQCVRLCCTSLTYIASKYTTGGRGMAMSKDESAALLAKYKKSCEFIYWLLFDDISADSARHLRRSPAAAAAIDSERVNRADAELFWSSVRDGDMLKKGEPAYRLREYLRSSSVRSTNGTRSAVDHREMYAKCIHAWNAFRKNRPTDLRYYGDKPLPKPD